MEYRSLFDTDTDTLLSEITSLEQQQGMYINPQQHLMSNYSSQPTPQQMQQSHIHNHQFINTNHYPDNRSSNANAGVGGGGGGDGGHTTNNQSMPQQQNTPNNNSNTTTATTTIQNVLANGIEKVKKRVRRYCPDEGQLEFCFRCEWDDCGESFVDTVSFFCHIEQHLHMVCKCL
jgi:hypothetical protein